MPITSSLVVDDLPQADGRRHIRERHTDQLGVFYFRSYLAEAGADIAATFPSTVAMLDQMLTDAEIAKDLESIYQLGPLAVVTTVYVSLADARAALREAYRTVTREQAVALGAYLNTLSNNQLGTIFNVSGAQLTALRTRLQTKATQWADYIAAAGE